MRVLCIKGEEGFLKESEVYTVWEVTEKGSYRLLEVDPPQPYTSFDQGRFVPLQDMTDEEMLEIWDYSQSNQGGE